MRKPSRHRQDDGVRAWRVDSQRARRLFALTVSTFAPAACVWPLLSALALPLPAGGCRPKATAAQCNELLDRYTLLVVSERLPDASPEQVALEREREKSEARADDTFNNCSSQVSKKEFDCAMSAPNAAALEKCLQ